MKTVVAEDILGIFNAPNKEEAERLLKLAIEKYAESEPKLSQWMEENILEGPSVFHFNVSHRRRLRTSNMAERVNKEILRRTRVATLFPNTESCERLVSAVLMEISEEWETGKIYLSPPDEKQ